MTSINDFVSHSTRKLGIAISAAAAFGMISSSVASAQTRTPSVFTVTSSDEVDVAEIKDNGALKKNDSDQTPEQSSIAHVTGNIYLHGVMFPGKDVYHRTQCWVTPLEMVADPVAPNGITFKKLQPGDYITHNKGNQYRNCHHLRLISLADGYVGALYNYQPQGSGDTKRYAQVLNAQGEAIPMIDFDGEESEQVVIMEKKNDDCSGMQSGTAPTVTQEGSTSTVRSYELCNGNGRDDGWWNRYSITIENGVATFSNKEDTSVNSKEERGRGHATSCAETPDLDFVTFTSGNNQPQRNGVWGVGVNNKTGEVLWKEEIDGRHENSEGKERIYSVRMKQMSLYSTNAESGALEPSCARVLHWGHLDGSNRNNGKKGGTYVSQRMAVVLPTEGGLEYLIPTQPVDDIMLGMDMTHVSILPTIINVDGKQTPGVAIMSGSQNANAGVNALGRMIVPNLETQTFARQEEFDFGAPKDRHLYCNYLGNNPGNQGRCFEDCKLIQVPAEIAAESGTTHALVCAFNGKDKPESQYKLASYVSLIPMLTADTGTGTAPDTGTGIGTGAGTGTGTDPGSVNPETSEAGGCQVGAGGAAGAEALLLALGLIGLVRRRRHNA